MNNTYIKKNAIGLIHKVYLAHLKNTRKYTASTKTKAEVAGGGKKPWKQKGTGQARAGSTRSPLWVGGGVIFGPKPRKVFKKINKKEKNLAIRSALFLKKADFIFVNAEQSVYLASLTKTKLVQEFLLQLGLKQDITSLFLVEKPNKLLWLITRNIKNTSVCSLNSLNIELLLKANKILLSTRTFELLTKLYGIF